MLSFFPPFLPAFKLLVTRLGPLVCCFKLLGFCSGVALADLILALFADCFVCVQALNEAEPEVNTIFSQTKQWSEFYTNELVLWGKLHTSVQRHIMAEFQLEIGLVHQQSDDSLW